MKRTYTAIFCLGIVFSLISGCATFRSGVKGHFSEPGSKNLGAEKVDVLFIFSHYEQARGYDAIPKLESHHQIIRDFDDLFIDACGELSNLDKYTTFTEYASDVSEPERITKRDSLIAAYDYVIRIKFMKEHSFAQHFLGTLFSTVSATLLPMPYSQHFSMEVNVFDDQDILLHSYKREASMTKWVQTLLVFVYPFHTEKRKEEEIYINLMHDVFRQIETERVLK